MGTASLDVVDPTNPTAHNRDTVVTISNLSPPANTGVLYVQFVGSTGNLGYLNAMQIVVNTPAGLTGDYNNNGTVDAADYVLWRNDPSTYGGDPAGYNTWRANFGRTSSAGIAIGGGTQGAVPEPGSALLAIIGAFSLFSLKRRR